MLPVLTGVNIKVKKCRLNVMVNVVLGISLYVKQDLLILFSGYTKEIGQDFSHILYLSIQGPTRFQQCQRIDSLYWSPSEVLYTKYFLSVKDYSA